MRLKQLLVTLLLPLAALSPASQAAEVTVKLNQQSYSFEQRPRLAEVLAPQALQQNWYWPASKLFKTDTALASQQQQLLQQLDVLAANSKEPVRTALRALHKEIAGWQVGRRIPLLIDYDLARAELRYNPRFETGDYQLLLSTRPVNLQFFGALVNNLTVPHRGATSVRDYIPGLSRLSAADATEVVIIQPNGELLTAGVQQWNKQHLEPMPGAMVYVPFADRWFSTEFSKLNQQILALAVHRVY